MMNKTFSIPVCIFIYILASMPVAYSAEQETIWELDRRIEKFLDDNSRAWRDWNVPVTDGRKLHDLIVSNNFRSALEIGTSTGHSAIWISRALNRTGGKLITLEIDRGRFNEAVSNFKQAGVEHLVDARLGLVDARLGDAHEIVYELEGPFDFIFSDADKGWYRNYMEALLPKLSPGGCFVAHNVRVRGNRGGIASMLEFARSRPDLDTVIYSDGAGMSISCRRK